jgi:hypothetical protein
VVTEHRDAGPKIVDVIGNVIGNVSETVIVAALGNGNDIVDVIDHA